MKLKGETKEVMWRKIKNEVVGEILREVESMDKRHTVGFVLRVLKQKFGVKG